MRECWNVPGTDHGPGLCHGCHFKERIALSHDVTRGVTRVVMAIKMFHVLFQNVSVSRNTCLYCLFMSISYLVSKVLKKGFVLLVTAITDFEPRRRHERQDLDAKVWEATKDEIPTYPNSLRFNLGHGIVEACWSHLSRNDWLMMVLFGAWRCLETSRMSNVCVARAQQSCWLSQVITVFADVQAPQRIHVKVGPRTNMT